MSKISVVIGTFGSEEWNALGKARAESLKLQSVPPVDVIHIHGRSLADARNRGAALANGEWLLFLDADDWLDNRFIEHMENVIADLGEGDFLVRPAIKLSQGRRDIHVLPERDIFEGNFMIIGTLVKRSMFLRVGGFRELPIFEDWDLWLRCVIDGAKYAVSPKSIYFITVRPDSRNNGHVAARTFLEIQGTYRRHFRK